MTLQSIDRVKNEEAEWGDEYNILVRDRKKSKCLVLSLKVGKHVSSTENTKKTLRLPTETKD